MSIVGTGNEPRFLFAAGGFEFLVVDFSAAERISVPFELDATLASEEEIKPQSMMGTAATMTFRIKEDERFFNGIVNRFQQTGVSGRFFLYKARVVPLFWLLSLERDCRIFQEKSVPDIVKKIMEETGITGNLFEFRLTESYPPRTYCVQYRESDLDFVSRLLEEEGIFYFFEHSEDRHLQVFGDREVAYKPIGGETSVTFNPAAGMRGDEEAVYRFWETRSISSGKYSLRDFNFKKPSLNLSAEDVADEDENLEVYDYPGIYEDTGTGSRLARIRLEEARMYRDLAEGESVCFRFIPGFKFSLVDHEIKNLNAEYLLTRVEQTGRQPQALQEVDEFQKGYEYHNEFRAVPSSVTIRPERTTRKPLVEGVQTAIVTGPAGEEVYPDEHGRVKVKFHWDRKGENDQTSSCWIRVSQLWAGEGWGAMAIPRIGQEVIVDFIDGDPDRPIIVGRVYHGANPPPYGLPAEKTKTTIMSNSSLGGGGYNEIRFEDKKGEEEIFVHGQKDWNVLIEHDKNQKIVNNETKNVGVDLTVQIGNNETYLIGNSQIHQVGNNRSRTVGNNESIRIGANKTEIVNISSTETVGAVKVLSVGAGFQVAVGGALNETVGGLKAMQVGGALTESVGAMKSSQVGGNESVDVGGDMSVNVGGDTTNNVGGKRTDSVKKEYTLKAKKVTIQAQDEIALVCGGAQIVLKKSGDILIKGKKITIKGSGDVTVKGSKIKEN